MLLKYKDVTRLDPKKDAIKPFENVSCQRRNQNFFTEGHKIFTFLSIVFFPEELI